MFNIYVFSGVMGFNIFLFLFSAYIVYDTTKSGAKMTSCGPKTNFHLYLRLAVIMGLTWVTGLAAGTKLTLITNLGRRFSLADMH